MCQIQIPTFVGAWYSCPISCVSLNGIQLRLNEPEKKVEKKDWILSLFYTQTTPYRPTNDDDMVVVFWPQPIKKKPTLTKGLWAPQKRS